MNMLDQCVTGGFGIEFGLDYELARERLTADAGRRFREYLEAQSVGAGEQLVHQARQAYVESAARLRRA